MNSRFKFRAWDKDIQKMAYFKDPHIDTNSPTTQIKFGLYDWIPIDKHCDDHYTHHEFNNVELMQCTGLKDKNGKDIYEGDQFWYGHYTIEVGWGIIQYEGGYETPGFGLFFTNDGSQLENYHNQWDDLEIIGNKYEGTHGR